MSTLEGVRAIIGMALGSQYTTAPMRSTFGYVPTSTPKSKTRHGRERLPSTQNATPIKVQIAAIERAKAKRERKNKQRLAALRRDAVNRRTPVKGQCYVTSESSLYTYDGAAWVRADSVVTQ